MATGFVNNNDGYDSSGLGVPFEKGKMNVIIIPLTKANIQVKPVDYSGGLSGNRTTEHEFYFHDYSGNNYYGNMDRNASPGIAGSNLKCEFAL